MAALDEKKNRPQVTMIRKAGLWKSGGLPTIFSLCELMIASVARFAARAGHARLHGHARFPPAAPHAPITGS